jgi:hypothetical protein
MNFTKQTSAIVFIKKSKFTSLSEAAAERKANTKKGTSLPSLSLPHYPIFITH